MKSVTLSIVTLTLCLPLAVVAEPVGVEASNRPRVPPPNVVVFLMDDMAVGDLDAMSRVKRLLVDEGTTFERAYSPFPLCCPARATILTGLYAHNHRVLDNVAPLGGAQAFDDSSTLATWLDPVYDTALIGKYLNALGRGLNVPPGWDTFKVPRQGDTYDYIGQVQNVNGRRVEFPGVETTSLQGHQARTFIQRANRPYFAYVSLLAPHAGHPADSEGDPPKSPWVAAKYRGTEPRVLPNDPSVNEADVSDKSDPTRPLLTEMRLALIREQLAQRRESLKSADDEIAATVAKVKAMGELDTTYFVFVSDNGWMQGQHRIPAGKHVAYEPAARVPLVIRGPGFPRGAVYGGVTGLQDIAPTILELTGQVADQRVDGLSLLSLVSNARNSRRPQLIEIPETAKISDEGVDAGVTATRETKRRIQTVAWRTRGIVTPGGWKYIEYEQADEVELYHLKTDPFEENNIAGELGQANRVTRLAEWLRVFRKCSGRSCR